MVASSIVINMMKLELPDFKHSEFHLGVHSKTGKLHDLIVWT